MNIMNVRLNNSVNYNNSNSQLHLKSLLNIWTLLNVTLATIVSLFIIIYVVTIYISKKNSKNSFHVSLVLTCNTSLAIIGSSITLCLSALSSIGDDRDIVSFQKIIYCGCHIRGYLSMVFITSIYLSYVLQAVYRLFRIVYHKYKYLRATSTFSYYILTQWLLAFVLILPMVFLDKNYSSFIVYSSEQFNCLVPFTNIRGIIFLMATMFFFPFCYLILIYSWIIIHIKHKQRQPISTFKLRRQNKRDTIIIKRICVVMILLLTLGVPSAVFFIQFVITGHLHWAAYRISSMTTSLTFVFISLSSLYVTPQIYKKMRSIFGYSKHHTKYHRVSYSFNIIIERERKIESLLLENTSFTDPNILI
jgi:hypothetical protein